MSGIETCRFCGEAIGAVPLLTLENMPYAAQHFPAQNELDQDCGCILEVVQCAECGLIQLTGEPVPYYRDVIRATGCSEEMRCFRERQFRDWIQENSLSNARILEVGCGNGEYMTILKSVAGSGKVFGVEHEPNAVEHCRKLGLEVEQGFFGQGETELLANHPFHAFVILSWLEHIPNLRFFLKTLRNNLVDEAVGLVEVPNFDMMLASGMATEFIADHLYYFTETTLRHVLEGCGFEVLGCSPIWHDYILSAKVRLRGGTPAKPFVDSLQVLRKQLNEYLKSFSRVAVWGAGHQALATLALAGIADRICFVVDSAPFKQGKFTMATHIPIVSPETLKKTPVDAVIVMCGSYSDELVRLLRGGDFPPCALSVLRGDCLEVLQPSI